MLSKGYSRSVRVLPERVGNMGGYLVTIASALSHWDYGLPGRPGPGPLDSWILEQV